MRKIVVGIRPSQLAKAQLKEFQDYLSQKGMDLALETKIIRTRGDTDQNTPIDEMGQGIFIKEIERKLLSGEIDCAVHSLKDMPVDSAKGTLLACFPPRADERDCLVSNKDVSLKTLKGLSIATGSPRRAAFLKENETAIKVGPLRGNVDTRLRKLDDKEFDVMVLAACGLKRIGLENRITSYLDSTTFVPAAGQGAICAQVRSDDNELVDLFEKFSCADTKLAVCAERNILKALGVGCRMPFGVFARIKNDEIVISVKAFIKKNGSYIYFQQSGPKSKAESLTDEIIKKLKDATKNCRLK